MLLLYEVELVGNLNIRILQIQVMLNDLGNNECIKCVKAKMISVSFTLKIMGMISITFLGCVFECIS